MTWTVDVRREVARIVDAEWFGAQPPLSETGEIERVTHIVYLRPLGEIAPYWQVWIAGRPVGVRPKSEIDCAWLRIATALSV